MHIAEALAAFRLQLDADGRSPHTRGQYERHTRLLGQWMSAEGLADDLGRLAHGDLARFLASPAARQWPDGRAKRATTTNALRTSMRCLFAYLADAGLTPSNPARLVRRARCGPPPPRVLTDDESQRLLAVLAKATDPAGRRDHVLVSLLLATGVRIGSALALRVEDADLERGEVTLRSMKNDRPERVFLGRAIRELLAQHLAGRTAGPVFEGRPGKPLCSRQAQRRLGMWAGRAGIAGSLHPHVLRHSFAAALYSRTGDLALVQKALCHRSIASTLVYASCDDERLRRALCA